MRHHPEQHADRIESPEMLNMHSRPELYYLLRFHRRRRHRNARTYEEIFSFHFVELPLTSHHQPHPATPLLRRFLKRKWKIIRLQERGSSFIFFYSFFYAYIPSSAQTGSSLLERIYFGKMNSFFCLHEKV